MPPRRRYLPSPGVRGIRPGRTTSPAQHEAARATLAPAQPRREAEAGSAVDERQPADANEDAR